MSASYRELHPLQGAENIAEFLDLWLRGDLLTSAEQEVLEGYYTSYKNTLGRTYVTTIHGRPRN